jgi:uncharacterized protein
MPGERATVSLRPKYFIDSDLPWLSALLEERERFVGRKRREWKARLANGLPVDAPRQKLLVALRVLDRLARDAAHGGPPARVLRAVLFREAARSADRSSAVESAASKLGIDQHVMMECLFSDLPDERVLTAISPTSPDQLALLGNSEVIAKLLARALRVRIWANGNVRALVRQAKLMGLLCNVTGSTNEESVLDISGPFSLFRHTRIYARALSALVPRLAWCHRFSLEADCVFSEGGKVGRLHLRSGDPIFPARPLPSCDSQLEQRFFKGFSALAPEWHVIREPVAVAVGDGLIFPDFELRQRATGECWLLEIVGFWTPEYLRKKYAGLRAAQIKNLILCIDEERCCDDKALEITEHVVRYRRHIDPRDVLAIVDPRAHALLPIKTSKHRRARPKV